MKTKKRFLELKVKIAVVEGVNLRDLKAYMKAAIRTWGGQRHPEDPLFYPWEDKDITITRLPND